MTQAEQQKAAKIFIENWTKQEGYEKGENQKFWIDLLCNVFGIKDFTNFIYFEDRIKEVIQDKTITNFIDCYIPATKVMIEQKSSKKDLREPILQSDGIKLTPFQQARKYIASLPLSQHPRWVVTCNFNSFLIYDMEQPNGEPEEIFLKDLEKEIYRLSFLTGQGSIHLKKELEISKKAGDIIGEIYDAILAQYKDAAAPSPDTLKSLNMLCVRIVFCLYAEDAGIFGHKSMFGDYLKRFDAKDLRRALLDLFQVLDQKPEERDPYLEEDLAKFPYVNGGLFTEEDKTIPQLTEEIKELLVKNASSDFNWSEISPTIFGAIFESTLNPETRRSGGMHYTSIENIHKVIDPLFLDELNAEYEEIKQIKTVAARNDKLIRFQAKLGTLKFLDPACGSGNFLTETYLSLRRLENKCIQLMIGGNEEQGVLTELFGYSLIKVHIQQFYGIEINDFACVVAKTALWIAECQMLQETSRLTNSPMDFLPLDNYSNITEGNALRVDWNDVVSAKELNYIMGNPPFVGYKLLSKSQKEEINLLIPKARSMDYVVAWYFKALEYIENNTDIQAAFVSTNSITQGDAIENVWKPMFVKHDVKINFAWQTFKWNSESNDAAAVHCVIIGFGLKDTKYKKIFTSSSYKMAKNINPYLMDADNIFLERLGKPLCNVPEMTKGAQLIDGGGFVIESENEKQQFLKDYPESEPYIYQYLNANDFLNNEPKKYCLYLKNCPPGVIRNCKGIYERVKKVQEYRANSNAETTRILADKPTLFFQSQVPEEESIVIPVVSSENRRYIPMDFMPLKVVYTNALFYLDKATKYHFGILESNVHMAWMRVVCGRLEMRYRYSNTIVYNNFPWPEPSEEQKEKISITAQAILDTRAKYSDCSLADLYDETVMPADLRKAHRENDRAVMDAYGFSIKMSESECVAELFKMYEKLTK